MVSCALQLLVIAIIPIIAAAEYPIEAEIIRGYYESCPSEQQLDLSRQSILAKVKFLVSGGLPPCGESDGWRRIAFLNMNSTSQECPSAFREITSPIRCCGRGSRGAGCFSHFLQTGDAQYSQVCGRIIGYQISSTDGFNNDLSFSPGGSNINFAYVDGISLTYGNPRNHIWTFAAGSNEHGDIHGCYCNGSLRGALAPPIFVGHNYFCESARHVPGFGFGGLYQDDPLWDGMNCVVDSCCKFNTPPWFMTQLPSPTTDNIELRLCLDQPESDENVAFQLVEIYVK